MTRDDQHPEPRRSPRRRRRPTAAEEGPPREGEAPRPARRRSRRPREAGEPEATTGRSRGEAPGPRGEETEGARRRSGRRRTGREEPEAEERAPAARERRNGTRRREAERAPRTPVPTGDVQPLVVEAEEIDRDALDRDAQRVVSRLQRHGHEAFFVGGCVRDLLIGRVPKDFDVATSAEPTEIRRMFRNGRIIGRRFKLVHVYYGDHIIETSTFRRDPARDEEGAEREEVALDDLLIVEDNEYGTAAEDARRRDFTVNALFLDPNTNTIFDYVDGLADLEKRLLRTIGDPFVRLAEDPVRIMRAIKFASRLDFQIEEETWRAMCELSAQLSLAAPPRVLEEILRLLRSRNALGAFRMLRACGALRVLLPELDEYLGPREDPGPEATRRAGEVWRLLEALDTEIAAGMEPSTAVCLAVLYLPLVERELDPETRTLPGPPGEPADVCHEVMEPMAATTRLSRRDFGRARKIIELQRRFVQSGTSKRFSPVLFARSEDFPEAFELFRIRMQARGQGSDIVDGWEARRRRAMTASEDELEAERKRIKKRRRRRKPRRRS